MLRSKRVTALPPPPPQPPPIVVVLETLELK
jgi:hypothetical protein